MKKKLIVFDLDGTLTESKSPLDIKMAELLQKLMEKYLVSVISGGWFPQFEKQFLSKLSGNINWSRLYIFPTCGASFYRYENDTWEKVYCEEFTEQEKNEIISGIKKGVEESGIKIVKTWGPQIQDRKSQITFSALGQEAPVEEKKKWDSEYIKRPLLRDIIEKYIPQYEVRTGGSTSIDVTKRGIDKAYGITKMEEIFGIPREDMLFIGDALDTKGNDFAVKKAGVECIEVNGPMECMEVIKKLISDKEVN